MTEAKDEVIYQVLADITLEQGTLNPQGLIPYLSGDWHRVVFSQSDLERAVDHCMLMGWIKVLTEEDCEKDRVRWLDDPHQNWSEGLYEAGDVDLTPTGWNAYAGLAETLRNRRMADMHRESLHFLWRTPGRISALSMSQELLTKEKEAILSGSDELHGGGSLSEEHAIGEISGPYAIGPWWVTRFYLAPIGYRLDVEFEPADMNF